MSGPDSVSELRVFCRRLAMWLCAEEEIHGQTDAGRRLISEGRFDFTAIVEVGWYYLRSIAGDVPYPRFRDGPYHRSRACEAIERIVGWCDSQTIDDSVRHSPDFRSFRWFGTDYSFTDAQAACVKVLYEAWKNGTPDVGEYAILQDVGNDSGRLVDTFKGQRGQTRHDAWKRMIVAGKTKGSYRLQEPKTSDTTQIPL